LVVVPVVVLGAVDMAVPVVSVPVVIVDVVAVVPVVSVPVVIVPVVPVVAVSVEVVLVVLVVALVSVAVVVVVSVVAVFDDDSFLQLYANIARATTVRRIRTLFFMLLKSSLNFACEFWFFVSGRLI